MNDPSTCFQTYVAVKMKSYSSVVALIVLLAVVMDFSSGLLPSKQTPSDATAESYWYLLDSPDVSPRTVVSRGKAKRETSTLPQVQRLLHNELPPEY
ncbi:uncharacterized protein [Dermacentor albipictus]|uniref:uncharacterized protein isoform X3 n=1 Tax=Dermacentor albipictus TaxID=60249 RepID=UPI0031FC23BB